MSIQEFEIIEKYFTKKANRSAHVLQGVGDDAALIALPTHHHLATSIDTLVAGRHFPLETPAYDIGYKSLAVSLSDMAAMGAKPLSTLLSLTLPHANKQWLKNFSAGFFALANAYKIKLIGGDTTQGPLSITTVVNGIVPQNQAICRHRAKPGDKIYVSGTLGDAGLAIHLLNKNLRLEKSLLLALNRPDPRVHLGMALRNIATAAIDISDGLAADLRKILQASKVDGIIYADDLPLSSSLLDHCSRPTAIRYALSSGDDYELCFTVPPKKQPSLIAIAKKHKISLCCIGEITHGIGKLEILDAKRKIITVKREGYQHFAKK